MRVSIRMTAFLMMAVVSVSGCLGSTSMTHETDSDMDGLFDSTELSIGTDPNSADTDMDGMNDGEEVINKRDPNVPDDTGDAAGLIQPYGKSVYFVGPTMGAYSEDGAATFVWTFTDQNGYKPSNRKFACVTPAELPDDFWDSYDTRKALMEQDWIDKKANNLYIPFNDDGEISFSIDTQKIEGKYSFKICGILNENYIDEDSYAGDGDKVTVEVTEPVEVSSLRREGEETGVGGYTGNYICALGKWYIFEGDDIPAASLDDYEMLAAPDGNTHSGIFLLSEKVSMVEPHPYLPYQSTDSYEVYKWAGVLQGCGEFGYNGKCGYGDDGILYYTVCLRPWQRSTLSILNSSEKLLVYSGTGDSIEITYPDEDSSITITIPDS